MADPEHSAAQSDQPRGRGLDLDRDHRRDHRLDLHRRQRLAPCGTLGWVVGGVTLGNRYLAKTALLRGVLRVEEEDWRIAPSA